MEERTVFRSTGKEGVYRRRRVFSWIISVVEALIILAIIFLVILYPVRVDEDSMRDMFHSGDLLMTERISQLIRSPLRGDVIAFSHPLTGNTVVRRVIASAGETVDIVAGNVYVDGRLLDESAYVTADGKSMRQVTVPDGCLFVLNDDRASGDDSRDVDFGFVSVHDVKGTVRLKFVPVGEMKLYI